MAGSAINRLQFSRSLRQLSVFLAFDKKRRGADGWRPLRGTPFRTEEYRRADCKRAEFAHRTRRGADCSGVRERTRTTSKLCRLGGGSRVVQ